MTEADSAKEYADRYGQGLAYSLALFMAHEGEFKYCLAEIEVMAAEGALRFEGAEVSRPDRVRETIERLAAVRWFARAANPLRNLVISDSLSGHLQDRLRTLKNKGLAWSLPESANRQPTRGDVAWALEEAREVLRLIDESHGVSTIKEQPNVRADRAPCLVLRD